MCDFKSAIVLRERIYMPLDYDEHSRMVEELQFDDNTKEPDFVRVEIIPIDGNIFNHDLKNWQLKVDQDYRPDWFSEKFALEEMKKEIQKVWEKRFVYNKTIKEIKEGRWFVGKNGVVKDLHENGVVKNVKDNGIIISYKKDINNPEIIVANKEIKLVDFRQSKIKKT